MCEGFATLGLDEIVSFVHPGNERSLAVTRRLGMSVEGDVPHPARPDTTVRILAIAASNPCSIWSSSTATAYWSTASASPLVSRSPARAELGGR